MPAFPSMITPSPASTAAFVSIVLALCVLFVLGVYRAERALGAQAIAARRKATRAGALLGGWLALTGAVSGSGVLEHATLPPPLALFFVASIAVAVLSARSSLGTRLIQGLPIAALVGVQAFRLPLELVLHAWKNQGLVPVQMTFEGHNFDIVTGVLAVVAGLYLQRSRAHTRRVVLAFNVVGTATLLAVMAIAVLSSPLPIRMYGADPALMLGYHFPYGWIVPICVGGALFGHVLVFRWLRAVRREQNRQTGPTPVGGPAKLVTRSA
jgi:hypothetical protein